MLFNSLTFLVFFIGISLLYRCLPSWSSQKNLLLIGSYLFYAAWNPPFVLLLMVSTVADWLIARRVAASEQPTTRKLWLLLSLILNLGVLAYFKYAAFLLDSVSQGLSLLGISYQPPALNIILPVGISFYTFQSLSYTLDVYRRELKASWSLRDYALFVSFFPQLVAGPIVRAHDFLPQLQTPRRASADQFGWGISLLIFGVFQKTVLADSLFAPIVDRVYAHLDDAGRLDAWAALFGFSAQIFYDFAGYSLGAIGAALTFGLILPQNFNYPYAALGFSDFWRRWHMSLSGWLRDYLYIPLGGNAHGRFNTYRNLLLTMLIGGLWHGASVMFLLWGLIHGLLLVGERLLKQRFSEFKLNLPGQLLLTALCFVVISFTWLPFRAPDWAHLSQFWSRLWGSTETTLLEPMQILLCLMASLATFGWHFYQRHSSAEARFSRLTEGMQALLLAALLILIFLYSGGDERAFIYFQF